jgi:DNA-binding GntR family transcriptional regulator
LTLRAQAYDKFVNELMLKNIKPGQFVTQRELVALTGFPLGAVRELIPRLEGDGLILALDRRGLQVTHVDVDLVRNAYQLRLILETEAVTYFTRHATAAAIEELEEQHREILRRVDDRISQELADEAQKVDWRMHDTLVAFLGNEIIANVYRINAIKVRLAYQDRLRLTANNVLRVMAEHMRIIEAMKARDVESAVTVLTAHIEKSKAMALGGSGQ